MSEEQTKLEEFKEDQVKLEDLDYVKSGGPNDEELTKLDGCRTKIAKVEVIKDTSRYKDGKLLPDEEVVDVMKVRVETAMFGEELIGRTITHREKYNLKQEVDGSWIVSLHDKAKTAQFLSKYKVDKFENAVGVEVVLVKKTNPDTKRSWLTISI